MAATVMSPSCLPLFKEELVKVRTMDLHVARRTRLVLLALVVERRQTRCAGVLRQRMAFQAQQIHLGAFQQAGIRGTVRLMTRRTAFRFHRHVFKSKRASLLDVALETNLILCGRRS